MDLNNEFEASSMLEELPTFLTEAQGIQSTESLSPTTQIIMFVSFGFFVSLCCVCTFIALNYDSIGDAFKDDEEDKGGHRASAFGEDYEREFLAQANYIS